MAILTFPTDSDRYNKAFEAVLRALPQIESLKSACDTIASQHIDELDFDALVADFSASLYEQMLTSFDLSQNAGLLAILAAEDDDFSVVSEEVDEDGERFRLVAAVRHAGAARWYTLRTNEDGDYIDDVSHEETSW